MILPIHEPFSREFARYLYKPTAAVAVSSRKKRGQPRLHHHSCVFRCWVRPHKRGQYSAKVGKDDSISVRPRD